MKTLAGLRRTAQSSSLLLRNNAATITSKPDHQGLLSSIPIKSPRHARHAAALFSTTSGRSSNETTIATAPSVSDKCRAVMRQLPHPVVVITTIDYPDNQAPSSNSPPAAAAAAIPTHWSESEREAAVAATKDNGAIRPIPRAMTVSSFTSLTLKPEPRVMFNVTLPSRTHSAIIRNGWFNVHVLSGDEYGARVADALTHGSSSSSSSSSSNNLGVLGGLTRYGIEVLGRRTTAGDNNEWGIEVRAPLLKGRGIVKVLRCEVHAPRHIQLLETADEVNSVVVGGDGEHENYTLVIARVREVVEGQNDDDGGVALGYVDGAYRRGGDPVLRHSFSVAPPDDGQGEEGKKKAT